MKNDNGKPELMSREVTGCVQYCLKHGKDDLADWLEPVAMRLNLAEGVLTEWNFGPMSDREALIALHDLIGDNMQGAS